MATSKKEKSKSKGVVGITMLGNTTKAVERIKKRLDEENFEVIIFHSSGVGGAAMEEMIKEGDLTHVIDFTTNELTDHLVGGFHDAGPKRLEAAGEKGLPQVVVPGCVDFFAQGPKNSIPEKWQDRGMYFHNPSFTLIRTSRDEMAEIGKRFATKLNKAKAPVRIAIPLGGLSIANHPGGELYDPEGDQILRDAIHKNLRKEIPCVEVDAHINDEAFSNKVLDLFFELIGCTRYN